ncbi:sulfotransferase domain-containing protein [Patescibacteria group bacterium]
MKIIDFIGIGAARSGTTWISQCLSEHPQIFLPEISKEVNFFNTPTWGGLHKDFTSEFYKGIEWYYSQFNNLKPRQIQGEFSVSYLPDPKAAQRIYEYFPHVKILGVFRNPAKAVYSMYTFLKSSVKSPVPKTFQEVVKTEHPLMKQYLYYEHVKKFLDLFPKKQMHFMILENFINDRSMELRKLYAFLGVDTTFVPQSLNKRINPAFAPRFNTLRDTCTRLLKMGEKLLPATAYQRYLAGNRKLYRLYTLLNTRSKSYEPLGEKEKRILTAYYMNDIEKFEKVMGLNVDAWKYV